MMNRNIDILNIKKIYAHQLFNKDILLMKKKARTDIISLLVSIMMRCC